VRGVAILARRAIAVLGAAVSSERGAVAGVVAAIARQAVVVGGTRAVGGRYAGTSVGIALRAAAAAYGEASLVNAEVAGRTIRLRKTAARDRGLNGNVRRWARAGVACILGRAGLAGRAEAETAGRVTFGRSKYCVHVHTSTRVITSAALAPVVGAQEVDNTTDAVALSGLANGSDDFGLTVAAFGGTRVVDDNIKASVDEPSLFGVPVNLCVSDVGWRVQAEICRDTSVRPVQGAKELRVHNVGVEVLQDLVLDVVRVDASLGQETTTAGPRVVVLVAVHTGALDKEVGARLYEAGQRRVVCGDVGSPDEVRLRHEAEASGGVQVGNDTAAAGLHIMNTRGQASTIKHVGLSRGVTAQVGNQDLRLYEDLVTNVNVRGRNELVNNDSVLASLPAINYAHGLAVITSQNNERTARIVESSLGARCGEHLLASRSEVREILDFARLDSPIEGHIAIQQVDGQTIGLQVEDAAGNLFFIHRNDERTSGDANNIGRGVVHVHGQGTHACRNEPKEHREQARGKGSVRHQIEKAERE
jgi:hypothetical protein